MLNFFRKKPDSPKANPAPVGDKYLAVLEVSNIVAMSLEIGEIMQKSVDILVSKLGYFSAVIFVNDPINKKIFSQTFTNNFLNQFMTSSVAKGPFNSLYVNYSDSQNFIVQTVLEKKGVESEDLAHFLHPVLSASVSKLIQKVVGIKVTLSIPIVYRDECLGAIMFTRRKDISFEEDIKILHVYASQLAIAMYNARSFHEKQEQIQAIKNRNYDLESLFRLTSQIVKSLDPDIVAQKTVDSIPQDQLILGTFLDFYDKDSGIITLKAISTNPLVDQVQKIIGDFSQYKTDINNPDHQGNTIVKAIKTGEMQVSDELNDLISPPIPKIFTPAIKKLVNISSAVVFPLKTRGEITGAIAFLLRDKTFNQLEDHDRQLLFTYALQIGIALENANLFKNLEIVVGELKEARRKERDMIDVMAHELRTPISIVRNAVLMLEREYEKHAGVVASDKLRKYLDMAIESARREITLIETLLSATKIDASRMQLTLTKVDLRDVVNDGIEGQRRLLDERSLKLNYTPPNDPIFVYADRVSIQQIMDNFLSNAAKYTNHGEIMIKLWLDHETKQGFVSVKDTGVGIDQEDMQHLGKKFFRAKPYIPSTDSKIGAFIRPGGTGLGLYVSFNLVRVLGGKLYINSKVAEGSNFAFSLPLFTGQEDKQIAAEFPGESEGPREHIVLNSEPA